MQLSNYKLTCYSLLKIFKVLNNDGFNYEKIEDKLLESKLLSYEIDEVSLSLKIQLPSDENYSIDKKFIRTNKFVMLLTTEENSVLKIVFVNHNMFFLEQELQGENVSHITSTHLDKYFNNYNY